MRIVRRTGAPVHPEAVKAYEADFQAAFDKAQNEARGDMDKMQKLLEEIDKELATKYGTEEQLPLPTTQKGWRQLIDTYGAPVLVARSADNPKELILVLMDVPL